MGIYKVVRLGDLSTGSDGLPPSPIVSDCSTRTFINGKPVALDGSGFSPHSDGDTTHGSRLGIATSSVIIEGRRVLREGDPISCGDTTGEGSPNTVIGD